MPTRRAKANSAANGAMKAILAITVFLVVPAGHEKSALAYIEAEIARLKASLEAARHEKKRKGR